MAKFRALLHESSLNLNNPKILKTKKDNMDAATAGEILATTEAVLPKK